MQEILDIECPLCQTPIMSTAIIGVSLEKKIGASLLGRKTFCRARVCNHSGLSHSANWFLLSYLLVIINLLSFKIFPTLSIL